MATYRVVADGEVVWTAEAEYVGAKGFPPNYLDRPLFGSVELWIDDELVGVQTPLEG